MHAVIRRYVGNPRLGDQLAEHADDIRSALSTIDGFRAYYLIRGDDATASITVCDDRAGCEESGRRARQWLLDNLPDATVEPPEITGGDVLIDF